MCLCLGTGCDPGWPLQFILATHAAGRGHYRLIKNQLSQYNIPTQKTSQSYEHTPLSKYFPAPQRERRKPFLCRSLLSKRGKATLKHSPVSTNIKRILRKHICMVWSGLFLYLRVMKSSNLALCVVIFQLAVCFSHYRYWMCRWSTEPTTSEQARNDSGSSKNKLAGQST